MTYQTPNESRLNGFPSGWYALAFSKELTPGTVLRRKLMNHELVVYRTESGIAAVKNAHCPHLGAHLAEGGKVVGEELQCPFHGFKFNLEGNCSSTPYGKRLPKMCIPGWPIEETNGVILCFYDADAPNKKNSQPRWQVKPIEQKYLEKKWSQPVGKMWTIRTHPAEIIENTVDVGHFATVHEYQSIEINDALTTDGPHLTMGYLATRTRGLFGKNDPNKLKLQLDINASGVGYSRVQVKDSTLGLNLRLIVMPTPIDDENVEVRVVAQAAEFEPLTGKLAIFDKLIPRRLIAKIIAHIASKEMGFDFGPDISIWENKRYLEKPRLAQGDGPIMPYRKWTQQFYNDSDATNSSASSEYENIQLKAVS